MKQELALDVPLDPTDQKYHFTNKSFYILKNTPSGAKFCVSVPLLDDGNCVSGTIGLSIKNDDPKDIFLFNEATLKYYDGKVATGLPAEGPIHQIICP